MFDKQYRFSGKHAEMVNKLTAVFDADAKSKLFERNVDVYINAPLIGFLYNRKAKKDSATSNDATQQNVFPEQMINSSDLLKYNLKLILLLDTSYEPDQAIRLDKAFRKLGADENDLALFDEYVLGGVEVLYEKLMEGASSSTEYLGRMYDFLEEFNERFNEEISNNDILDLCNAK